MNGPYYDRHGVTVHAGDCLDVLRELPDASVHAVICDPPYGLSDLKPAQVTAAIAAWASGDRENVPVSGKQHPKRCLHYLVRDAVVRDAGDYDPELGEEGVHFAVTCSAPGLAVLMRGVHFDDQVPPGKVEVGDVGTPVPLDDVLVDERDSSVGEGVGQGQLALRVRQGAAACVGECRCYRQFGSSTLRVLVRLGDDPFADAEGSPDVVAVAGAEVRAVLALDLVRRTGELLPAGPADEGDTVLCLARGPKGVRALPGAGRAASVFEARGVDQVARPADGALAFDVLVKGLPVSGHGPSVSPSGFMGMSWDAFVPPPAVWDECLRVLTPGGHLVAFAGSRTYDLMGLSIRMAGFEIRDGLQWLYGSGMPKGQNVGKAIDATILHGGANSRRIRQVGEEREVVGPKVYVGGSLASARHKSRSASNNGVMGETVAANAALDNVTAPATPEAAQWSGWNTSLKGAHEPIVLARKPLSGTVAANVVAHGTGALHVDACRTGGAEGRWPANVLLDEGAAAELDAQSGILHSQNPATRASKSKRVGVTGFGTGESIEYADKGGASRFFPTFRYQAKAPASERPKIDGISHPTVKPLTLMRWLVRLVTPPGGLVLDPFAGSGTTLEAAHAEGFRAIGIEREPSYLPLIKARLDARPRAASGTQTATDNEPMDLLDLLTEDGAA